MLLRSPDSPLMMFYGSKREVIGMLVEEWDVDKAIAVAEREAEERGEENRALKIARKMKDRGKNVDEIADMTGLTIDDILRL